jgi:hypothetical protein
MATSKKKKNVLILCSLVIAALVIIGGAEFFIYRHTHTQFDGLPLFEAWFSFSACIVFVLIAKTIGWLIKRPENYYENKG